ncbi:transposase [Acinetobacter sp. COS3]|uniref:transposase n=1 Tax=Acinetobacter sp. COS3 TaxID=1397525 RepID=UPI0039B586F1
MMIHYETRQIISTAIAHGSVHDVQLFRRQRKKQRYKGLLLADKGYQGLNRLGVSCLIPIKSSKKKPLTLLHKQINREIGKRRIRIEHVNGKLKTFKILAERYRNRRKRMGLRLNLIAAIYNMELVNK